jgi:FkbM family methyltransferase
MKDLIGNALRATPHFPGKRRLRKMWEWSLKPDDRRVATLPDGSRVHVDLSVPYERRVWLQSEEWDELRYLRRKLRAGESFADVGANIGLWTLVAASAVGRGGRVFSFEPNTATFAKLVENISLNEKWRVVEAFAQAVSNTDGFVFFACETAHNLSAITTETDGLNVLQVPAKPLDSLLSGPTPVARLAGIKLDTGGHEPAALEGAAQLLAQHSPWLIAEFNTTLLPSEVLGEWAVYKFLAPLGYRAFIYDGTGAETPVDAALAERGYRNILFQKAEQ